MKNMLKAKQVAEILNVHVYTVYDLLKRGALHGFKLKTHWRITSEELDKFMKQKGGKQTHERPVKRTEDSAAQQLNAE